MIGSFSLQIRDSEAQATLLDSGDWSCTDKTYERVLNELFSAKGHKPQDGYFGLAKFQAAVGYFQGCVLVPPVPRPGPEGIFEH